jgi:hypothetical protein
MWTSSNIFLLCGRISNQAFLITRPWFFFFDMKITFQLRMFSAMFQIRFAEIFQIAFTNFVSVGLEFQTYKIGGQGLMQQMT